MAYIYTQNGTSDITSGAGTGKVGIGTSSPDDLLHVFEGDASQTAHGDSQAVLENSGNAALSILSGASSAGSILFGDTGSPYDGYIQYLHGDGMSGTRMLKFATGEAVRLVIDSGGKAGIGTTSPGSLLDIEGSTSLLELTRTSGAGGDPVFEMFDSTTQSTATKKLSLTRNSTFRLGRLDATAPDFWWDGANTKLLVKSVLMEEQGDTCELALRRCGGTPPTGARTALSNGDVPGRIYWQPWDGTSYEASGGVNGEIAELYASCDGNPSQTNRSGKLHLRTTAPNETGARDRLIIDKDGNMQFGLTESFGGAKRVIGIQNCDTNPSSNPSGGGILYAESGALKWRGSSGTSTTMGNAEPHCPACGADFMLEWASEKWGYLALCIKCLAQHLGERAWVIKRTVSE
jgi:hypothetical protein